jgi:hypothetical protein
MAAGQIMTDRNVIEAAHNSSSQALKATTTGSDESADMGSW